MCVYALKGIYPPIVGVSKQEPHKTSHPFYISDLAKLSIIALKSGTINDNFTKSDIPLGRNGEPLARWLDPYQTDDDHSEKLASRTCQNLKSILYRDVDKC